MPTKTIDCCLHQSYQSGLVRWYEAFYAKSGTSLLVTKCSPEQECYFTNLTPGCYNKIGLSCLSDNNCLKGANGLQNCVHGTCRDKKYHEGDGYCDISQSEPCGQEECCGQNCNPCGTQACACTKSYCAGNMICKSAGNTCNLTYQCFSGFCINGYCSNNPNYYEGDSVCNAETGEPCNSTDCKSAQNCELQVYSTTSINTEKIYNNAYIYNGGILNLTAKLTVKNAIIVYSGGRIVFDNSSSIKCGKITIKSGGLITHAVHRGSSISRIPLKKVNITADDIFLEEGGYISASLSGYSSTNTDGLGPGGSYTVGNNIYGGSYGGYGYSQFQKSSKLPYGSSVKPTDIGSSGSGMGTLLGGEGGGAIYLEVKNKFYLGGSVRASGGTGRSGSREASAGGSGGSIYIVTDELGGGGEINTDGGNGGGDLAGWGYDAGGGGGGRIALSYNRINTTGAIEISADCGYFCRADGMGTIIVNGTQNPKLTAICPEESMNIYEQKVVHFKYILEGVLWPFDCQLIIDEKEETSTSNISLGIEQELIRWVGWGAHQWLINCFYGTTPYAGLHKVIQSSMCTLNVINPNPCGSSGEKCTEGDCIVSDYYCSYCTHCGDRALNCNETCNTCPNDAGCLTYGQQCKYPDNCESGFCVNSLCSDNPDYVIGDNKCNITKGETCESGDCNQEILCDPCAGGAKCSDTQCKASAKYCGSCQHCGDGVSNCNETCDTCPDDVNCDLASDLDVTGTYYVNKSESYQNVYVRNSGTLFINAKLKANNNMVVYSGGTVTHYAQNNSFSLVVKGNLTIENGGKIDVSGKGHPGVGGSKGLGSGGGTYYSDEYGGGAGYGGNGARNSAGNGNTYGSLTQPMDIGSSGGGCTYCGGLKSGAGGGVIIINVSKKLSIDGNILANGNNGGSAIVSGRPQGGGGGSGGSIYIIANQINGTGNISAKGGTGGGNSGGGAGGRIAIYYTTSYSK